MSPLTIIALVACLGVYSATACPPGCTCRFGTTDCKGISIGSGIRAIPSDTIVLHLSRSNISILPDGVFDRLSRVSEIDLQFNKISVLPEGAFSRNIALFNLYLAFNQIRELPEHVFDNLTNLHVLSLTKNNLIKLPTHLFAHAKNVQYLSLDYNKISELPGRVFDNLKKLKQLYLHANNLGMLPDRVFDNNQDLNFLSLASNNISEIPDRVFDNLNNLVYLMLQNNPIRGYSLCNLISVMTRTPSPLVLESNLLNDIRAKTRCNTQGLPVCVNANGHSSSPTCAGTSLTCLKTGDINVATVNNNNGHYTCKDGFRPYHSNSVATCYYNGSFDATCVDLRCKAPTLKGAVYIERRDLIASLYYDNGETLRSRCSPGHYYVAGDTERMCIKGSVTGQDLFCAPQSCATPSSIENGKVSLLNGTTTFGSVVKYSCNAGYKLDGAARATCTSEDGDTEGPATWSNKPPICRSYQSSHVEGVFGQHEGLGK